MRWVPPSLNTHVPTTHEHLMKAVGYTQYAVSQLMARAKLNWKWEIEPEQRECIEFADKLRIASSQEKLKAVWTHCPHEGKRSIIVGMILKAMGLIPGAMDFWFIGKNKGCLIEFKRPDKKLPKWEGNQEYFREWATSLGVPVYMHNNHQEALETLRREGLLI